MIIGRNCNIYGIRFLVEPVQISNFIFGICYLVDPFQTFCTRFVTLLNYFRTLLRDLLPHWTISQPIYGNRHLNPTEAHEIILYFIFYLRNFIYKIHHLKASPHWKITLPNQMITFLISMGYVHLNHCNTVKIITYL